MLFASEPNPASVCVNAKSTPSSDCAWLTVTPFTAMFGLMELNFPCSSSVCNICFSTAFSIREDELATDGFFSDASGMFASSMQLIL